MFEHRFIQNFLKYKFLLKELVKRNIKVKYRGSVLGIFWSFLNPLLNMIVLTIIFGAVFERSTIPNFPIYVLTGRLGFSFFSAGTTGSMNSIKKGSAIIKKIYVPKYIYALSTILSETVNLIISLFVLVLVMIATGSEFSIYNLTCIIPLFLLFLFIIGCGLILASVNVFFKDMKYLYSIFRTLLMYASAIFYPISIIPYRYLFIFRANPVYCAIEGFRNAILFNTMPNMWGMLYLAVCALLSLVIGIAIFYKTQDKFILHI